MKDKLGIIDLLALYGFDPSCKAKLVRHQDSRFDVKKLLKNGWFETYQSYQSKPVFECDYVVVFLGERGTQARFLGVYRVGERKPSQQVPLPPECPYPGLYPDAGYWYELDKLSDYANLEGRVVIEWGKGALAWHQRLRNKEVLEVRPPGEVRPPFDDYSEFVLTHGELVALIENQEANREWRARLAAVAGVYLIVASTTGRQYVGSAHGESGIWGRWEAYAANGHGGNAQLRTLVQGDPDYPDAFRYSVLQVLPKTQTRAEVIKWERTYKEKLGSRAHGLNLN